MPLPAELFRHVPPFPYLTQVRWKQQCLGDVREGEGVFVLHWLGIEECWDVFLTGGITIQLHPDLGDTMEEVR